MPKKYLHDRVILLLLCANAFLAFLCIVLVLLRLGAGASSGGYLVQYRANLGVSAFRTGSVTALLSFVGFAVLVFVTQLLLSVRTYPIRRELAVAILALGIPLLVLAIIVSNALLVLR